MQVCSKCYRNKVCSISRGTRNNVHTTFFEASPRFLQFIHLEKRFTKCKSIDCFWFHILLKHENMISVFNSAKPMIQHAKSFCLKTNSTLVRKNKHCIA